MPWLAVNEKKLPQFLKGEKIEVARVELYQVALVSSGNITKFLTISVHFMLFLYKIWNFCFSVLFFFQTKTRLFH